MTNCMHACLHAGTAKPDEASDEALDGLIEDISDEDGDDDGEQASCCSCLACAEALHALCCSLCFFRWFFLVTRLSLLGCKAEETQRCSGLLCVMWYLSSAGLNCCCAQWLYSTHCLVVQVAALQRNLLMPVAR